MAKNAEDVSIWWRHHAIVFCQASSCYITTHKCTTTTSPPLSPPRIPPSKRQSSTMITWPNRPGTTGWTWRHWEDRHSAALQSTTNMARVRSLNYKGCNDDSLITHLPLDKIAAILADDNFKCIFLNENDRIPIPVSLKFIPRIPIDNKPALVIGPGNGLVPNRRQAITWTNADRVHWRICAALGGWVNHYHPRLRLP